MSTPATPAPAPSAGNDVPQSLRLISHTGLVYWWPVWVIGFVMAGLTYVEGTRLAVLPPESTLTEVEAGKTFTLATKGKITPTLEEAMANTSKGSDAFPVRISWRKGFGIIYVAVVFLVVFGTNIPLRGLASFLAVLLIVLVVIAFSFLDWWTPILEFLGGLHIQISLAGYLIPSVVLLVLWLSTVFGYDRLRSVNFTPGQVSVFQDIGTSVKTYDATRVEVEKMPSDLLRHWILGLGAGDLVVRIANQNVQFTIPNVLFADHCMKKIATLLATRQVQVDRD